MLGLEGSSKTTENLRRTRQMVIDLPSVDQVAAVDRLAKTTGSNPVPADKLERGFRYEKRKFEVAGLTPVASETVTPLRVLECPVQLESRVGIGIQLGRRRAFGRFPLHIRNAHPADLCRGGHLNGGASETV
jgi:flavin reductase (DIM6/NTAB) family NADH-FMN oxidoreductase RutF